MHTYLLLGEVDLPSFLRRQLEHQLTIETQLVLQSEVYRISALSLKLMNVKTALGKSLLLSMYRYSITRDYTGT